MTRPEDRRRPPCKGCGGGKPIYTDGEDFFKWDEYGKVYRAVDFKGDFYPLATHPAFSEQQLVRYFQPDAVSGIRANGELRVATEYDILKRTMALLVDAMTAHGLL